MMDSFDSVFAAQLEKWVLRELHGDTQRDGLFRSILGVNTLEELHRTKGVIFAYENVLDTMHNLIRQMNEPHRQQERPIPTRGMN